MYNYLVYGVMVVWYCGGGRMKSLCIQNSQKKKELQQRVVFQQHNSLIGGPTATSCPVCHKLCLGGEALMEHMKITHKDPNASGVASKYFEKTPSYIGLSNLLRHKLSAMYSLQKLYLLPN